VPVVWFVMLLAPRLASRRVVAAPRCCVASCAGIGIVSRGLAKPVFSELSVLPQCEVSLVGEGRRCKKMVFPAAIREKSQCWVVFSCDAHSVSAGLGRIRQPCVQSSIGPRANFLKMFAILRGKPRKKDIKMIIVTFLHYLEFSCFGSSTRCSARSEIDFS